MLKVPLNPLILGLCLTFAASVVAARAASSYEASGTISVIPGFMGPNGMINKPFVAAEVTNCQVTDVASVVPSLKIGASNMSTKTI